MDRSETARLLAAASAFTPSIPSDDTRAINAWHATIGHLDYGPAAVAVRDYYQSSRFPITPADIIEGVRRMTAPKTPRHLRCLDHPEVDEIAQRCPHCARLIDGKRVGPDVDQGVMAEVRRIAKRAALDSRLRELDREQAILERAGIKDAAEQMERERARQKAIWRAQNGGKDERKDANSPSAPLTDFQAL